MPRFNESLNRLRARAIALSKRMDWYRGLRAATALSTPLLLADVTGLSHMGWAGLGGIEAIVTDAGGPYRARLGRLSVLTLGGALGVFLGTLVGSDLRWALPITLLFCFIWTYLGVLGQPFASASMLVQVIYICGIGEPVPSLREAGLRAGFLLVGGAWATVLSLFLWPLDPYRPARAAIGKCYEALSAFLASVAAMQTAAVPEDRPNPNFQHKSQMRRLIEQAWDGVASVRAETSAETAQGRQLIVLLESADLILERTVALAEHTLALAEVGEQALAATSSAEAIAPLRRAADLVAVRLLRRGIFFGRGTAPESETQSSNAELAALQIGLSDAWSEGLYEESGAADADRHFFAQQLAEIASNLETSLESTQALQTGVAPGTLEEGAGVSASRPTRPLRRWDAQSVWTQLVDNWRPKSLLLRHAARVALVCGFDVCLIEERHVGHGYWLMMTSLIVLQPHVSGTLRRSLQRMGGTVGGGILAAFLAVSLHSQLVTGMVLFPLALLALALLPVNYAAFAFFLTPTFVLALLRHTGDWQLAALRVGNTVAGAAISIAAMTVLFPSYERERIGLYLRASIAANRQYLEQLMANWASASQDMRPVAQARRATGLAHNDMEESLERVLAETWARKTATETLLAFAAYLHRIAQTVTGLATLPEAVEWKQSGQVLRRLGSVRDQLAWLEERLMPTSSRAQGPWPRLPAQPPENPVGNRPGQRQLIRLERQTGILRRHLEAIKTQDALGESPPDGHAHAPLKSEA